jgi:hypothetical protein
MKIQKKLLDKRTRTHECRKSLWELGIELEVYAGSLSEVIANKEREMHGPLRVYVHDDVTTRVIRTCICTYMSHKNEYMHVYV